MRKSVEKKFESMLNKLYQERANEICEITAKEKQERAELVKDYNINYTIVVDCINSLPNTFKNTKETLMELFDTYAQREMLLHGYENDKYYKCGFHDAVNLLLECMDEEEIKKKNLWEKFFLPKD